LVYSSKEVRRCPPPASAEQLGVRERFRFGQLKRGLSYVIAVPGCHVYTTVVAKYAITKVVLHCT
jgi:hypothetical protein